MNEFLQNLPSWMVQTLVVAAIGVVLPTIFASSIRGRSFCTVTRCCWHAYCCQWRSLGAIRQCLAYLPIGVP
jgi:hypothetical protein